MQLKLVSLFFFILMASCACSQNTVEFSADMNGPITCGLFCPQEKDSVIVRGTFDGWAGDDFTLGDEDGDGIYRGAFTVEGDSGTVCDFKYLIKKAGGKALWEKKPNPSNDPHGSRQMTLNGGPLSLESSEFDFDKYYLAAIGKDVVFTVEELRADFRMFRETLENDHCCLYDFTDKTDFDRLFERQFDLIDHDMSPGEFYRILTPVTARIGCGHTAVWMPGGYWDIDRDNLFPLQIRLIEDQAVVAGSYDTSKQVARGSILRDINGRLVADIIAELRANYSADAFNPHFIDAQIERRFPLIFARRFGFPDSFVVGYRSSPEAVKETITLTPATDESVRAIVFNNFRHPPLEFELLSDRNTAVLTIPSFIYYDRVPYFTGFIDSCFAVIDECGVDNLVLDLRGNDGGDPFCAAPLFSHLQLAPVPYFSEPYGKYSDLAEPLPLPEHPFRGNLVTLLDGRCFSTNAHFCSLLDYHGIGIFVGTESGGTYTCNAGRNTVKRLEHSCIQLHFGRSSFATAVTGMDRSKPIVPDHRIAETYQAFIDGDDESMKTALRLIGEREE